MLVNWYIGNDDWDHNNWRCVRNRVEPDKGFKYLVWDAETAFTDVNYNKVEKKNGDPTAMMEILKKNPDFRKIAQERIEMHLTGNGVLTPSKAAALYEKIAADIDLSIIGESARWGDYRISTGETNVTYTRNDHWLPRKQELLNNFFPNRTANMLSHLEKFGLYDASGIDEFKAEPTSGESEVFDIKGLRVGKIPDIHFLDKGVYVTAGKKILVE